MNIGDLIELRGEKFIIIDIDCDNVPEILIAYSAINNYKIYFTMDEIEFWRQ